MFDKLKAPNNEPGEGRVIRIHPIWYSFIKYCEELRYGEIEKLKIQVKIDLYLGVNCPMSRADLY